MKRTCAVAVLCLLAVLLAFAADFWTKKPYTQWSRKDVKQLLTDSPWAKTEMLRSTQAVRSPGAASGNTADAQVDPTIVYAVYLRSAQPVREALVRSAQLDQKYDQLDEAGRKEFDAKFAQFLSADLSDKVIFQVSYEANSENIDQQLALFWQKETLESMQKAASLAGPDGKPVAPIAFSPVSGKGRAFQLAFPRPQGEFAKNAALVLEFVHPDLPGEPAKRLHFKFSFKDMQYRGALTY